MVVIGFMLLGSVIMSNYLSIEILCFMISFLIFVGFFFCSSYLVYMNLEMDYWGGDIFSYGMIMLSMFIGLLMLMGESKIKGGLSETSYKLLVMLILFIMYMFFMSLNILMFYLFFELVLIPMLFLILFFGYQPERLESGIYMLMYTSFGSLPLLVGVMLLGGGMSLSFIYMNMMKGGFYLDWWMLLMLAFLVKLPMYMFHVWLPKAHVEAPVSGSMILAGVLLKMGCYGMIRFSPYMNIGAGMVSLLMLFGLWGGILSAFICMCQLDMKKLIAYSSVVHMGLFLGGVSSVSGVGIYGGLIMMIGHGLCSSGLFYLVNMIYERLHTRSLLISKGVLNMVPWMMMWGFLLSAANSAAPPFLNIFGEIFLGMGVLIWDLLFSLLLLMVYFIGVAYSIYFYSVISHGKGSVYYFLEVKVSEYLILFLHFIPVLVLIFF